MSAAGLGSRSTSIGITVLLLVIGLGGAVGMGAFYREHWSGPFAGSVRYGAERELARYHISLVVLCLFVAAILGSNLMRGKLTKPGLRGLAGIGAAAAAGTTFKMTFPRGGDEGIIIWGFLAPLMGLAVLALLSMSIAAIVFGLGRNAGPGVEQDEA